MYNRTVRLLPSSNPVVRGERSDMATQKKNERFFGAALLRMTRGEAVAESG